MIYYFLFLKFDIFFNGFSKKYFYDPSDKRIFISLLNNTLNKKYFLNNGKNLLFSDENLLEKYIKIMDLIGFDIVFMVLKIG